MSITVAELSWPKEHLDLYETALALSNAMINVINEHTDRDGSPRAIPSALAMTIHAWIATQPDPMTFLTAIAEAAAAPYVRAECEAEGAILQ